MAENWVDDVLGFWFGELTPQDWYGGTQETDDAIRSRFHALYDRLKATPPVPADAREALAAIIVFDQFPRNIHRKKPEAFATDGLAIGLARDAVARGYDRDLTPPERQFLYMPYMHSEILAEQDRGVDLFKSLGNEEGVKYAIEHRDIVARFGRFPHRNRALGRKSTADETAFLEGHGGYGQ